MQYKTTISYENKKVEIKTTNKSLEGNFSLPDFLKKVRESKNHSLKITKSVTDFPEKDCKEYEEGKKRIDKDYLDSFSTGYKIPRKIKILGYTKKEETKTILAEKLKELRTQKEMPQFLFAAAIEVSRSTYASYETGRNEPDIHTLIKIADFYGVSLDYLVGRYEK